MQIFARTSEQTLVLQSNASESIESLAQRISCQVGASIIVAQAGRQLNSSSTVAECNLVNGSTIDIIESLIGGAIEPTLAALAKKYNTEKQICRVCYARLPPRATNCRKKKCGHSNQLRIKKKLK